MTENMIESSIRLIHKILTNEKNLLICLKNHFLDQFLLKLIL